MNINRLIAIILFTVLSLYAKDSLTYIGKLPNNSKSFWLTHGGTSGYWSEYQLRDDTTNNIKDNFLLDGVGFRFSVSDVVDTHNLFLYDDVVGWTQVASTDPTGGISIPGGGGSEGDIILPALQVANIAVYINRTYNVSNRAIDSLLQRTYGKRDSNESTYNFWVDAKYYDFNDDRYGINNHGSLQDSYMGFDKLINDNFTLGMVLGVEYAHQKSYADTIELDSEGYFLGPYLAYRVSEDIIIDSWIGYASSNVNTKVSDNSSGDFDLEKLFFTFNVTGNYALSDSFFILPKLGLYYSDETSTSFNLNLQDGGNTYQIPISKYNYNYGIASLSADFEYIIKDKYSFEIAPYANIGVDYAFERPYDGKIMVSLDEMKKTSKWNTKAKLGLRALVENKFLIDFNTAYSGLSESNVDIWSAHLSFSYVFK